MAEITDPVHQIPDNGIYHFPAWIVASGLPEKLSGNFKSPQAWLLFKTLVELDCATNPMPGVVDISAVQLSNYTGIDASKINNLAKKLRKASVIRTFLSDDVADNNLFQIITPLVTPKTVDELRDENLRWKDLPAQAFRYATDTPVDATMPQTVTKENKFQRVLEMYLNTVSSRMNTFIQDELILISESYDEKQILNSFSKARANQIQNLGWVIRDIHQRTKALKEKSSNSSASEKKTGMSDLQNNDELYDD